MIVVEWRAPRILMAAVVGASLAISGALFLNLTGNPLGSPDVIGFQTGSFTGALVVMLLLGGGSAATMLGGTSVFLVAAVLLARPMKLLQIGIPFAAALGRHVRRVQMLAVVVGVGLIALATATVGPISFIALAAPQIARRLARAVGLALGTSAGVGALLLLSADLIAQSIHPDIPTPRCPWDS